MGAATALNFGAGQDTYDMVGVYDRLLRLRATLSQQLAAEARRPAAFEPAQPDAAA